uniref:Uncharacterized protein n=1 Tax=Leersia perrieri TaxID=77586 RepID=A0A0D9WGP9_9ORYZ
MGCAFPNIADTAAHQMQRAESDKRWKGTVNVLLVGSSTLAADTATRVAQPQKLSPVSGAGDHRHILSPPPILRPPCGVRSLSPCIPRSTSLLSPPSFWRDLDCSSVLLLLMQQRGSKTVGSFKMRAQHVVSRSPCNKNRVFDSLESISEIDPSYRLFLEHLREDGNGYVLDAPRGDHGSPVFVRYAEDHSSNGDAVSQFGSNTPSSSLDRSQCNPNGKGPGVTSDKAGNVNVGHCFSPGTSFAMEASEIDESYATFLRLLKIKDGHMVIEPEPGITIVYGQAETPVRYDELRIGSSTNERDPLMTTLENLEDENAINTRGDGLRKINNCTSEREMDKLTSENMGSQDLVCIDNHGLLPYNELSDLNVYGDDQGEPLALSCGIPSTFDDKLNAVLSKPYDLNEYKELLRKATNRKLVSRQRHLRNASKPYATGAVGLSFLDHYPDLAIQIDSADSDERKLCLLRKFFFWLENLCHQGAYMPWIDKPLACNPIDADDYKRDSDPTDAIEIIEDEN